MKLYKKVDLNNIEKVVTKSYKTESVFLHHTGYIYGIGTAVDNWQGIEHILIKKIRPSSKGFVVLVHSVNEIFKYADWMNSNTKRLISQYLPGNLTVVLPCKNSLFKHVSLNDTVAFRVPENPVLCRFIELIGKPIVSTSINRSGNEPETELKSIVKNYSEWFDFGFVSKKNYVFGDGTPSTIVKCSEEGLSCIREAAIPFYEIKRSYEKSLVLFMCTGNICRSPIAEYLLKDYLAKHPEMPYRTSSFGLASEGSTIAANSSALLLQHNIDAMNHTSTIVKENLLREAWLILGMEEEHKRFFSKNFYNYQRKVFTIKEFCSDSEDINIEDPYQKDFEIYEKAFSEISSCLPKLIEVLEHEAKNI